MNKTDNFTEVYSRALKELVDANHARSSFDPLIDKDVKVLKSNKGFVVYKESSTGYNELDVEFIHVFKEHRGKEAGKELIDRLIEKYPDHSIGATIYDSNSSSQRLFSKLGFNMIPSRYYVRPPNKQ